jgi:hypothetical protein
MESEYCAGDDKEVVALELSKDVIQLCSYLTGRILTQAHRHWSHQKFQMRLRPRAGDTRGTKCEISSPHEAVVTWHPKSQAEV